MRIVFTVFSIFFTATVFAQDTTRLSLLFLGDIMQHDSQITDAYDRRTKKYDYDPCFQYVKPYFQSVDLTIGNLELTLAGPPYKGYPQFSAPDELLYSLKNAGVDVLVTANNHCVDTGKKGLERTIQMLDSLNIPHTGTFVDEVSRLNDHPLLIEKNGFRLALLNYTYGTNGLPVTAPNIVNRIDTLVIGEDLRRAKEMNVDAVIVFMHWGSEYQSLPSAWQKTVGEFCFRNGAQVVIGAHPHVLQPMEFSKEKNQLIAYSLGNFVSGQRKRYTDGGAMITFELNKITFHPDSAVTAIENPTYVLQWVYRTTDSEKNYYVLPVPKIENDTMRLIRDEVSKEAFNLFVNDSRELYGKRNLNVPESNESLSDSLITYKVEWMRVDADSAKVMLVPSLPYGIESDAGVHETFYYTGQFTKRREAEQYLKKLKVQFGSTQATVVEFVNGRRRE